MVGAVPVVVMCRIGPVQHCVCEVASGPDNRSRAYERVRLPGNGEHNHEDEETATHLAMVPRDRSPLHKARPPPRVFAN